MNKKSHSVGAIIRNSQCKILIQEHVKLNSLNIPGGKVNTGENVVDALMREMKEELGIIVMDFKYIRHDYFKDIEYPVGSGNMIDFRYELYEVLSYKNVPKVLEPDKCRGLYWMSSSELEKSQLSKTLQFYIDNRVI